MFSKKYKILTRYFLSLLKNFEIFEEKSLKFINRGAYPYTVEFIHIHGKIIY
jgi:hypothetical protein